MWWRDGRREDYFNKDPCKETDKWMNQSRNHLCIRRESSSEKQDEETEQKNGGGAC